MTYNAPSVDWNALDTTWAGAPYTPGVLDTIGPIEGAAVHVELGYWPEGSDYGGRWDEDLWDVAVWAGEVGPFDDVSCQVLSVRTTTGRDRPLDRFRTSTCTVELDDPAGAYSPWSTAPDPETYATIRPGIVLKVWIETDLGVYPRFYGFVNAITDVWPDPSPDLDARHTVVFQAHDRLGEVARYDGFEQFPMGAGELSGTRVSRILDNAGIVGPRALDPGTVTVQATTLAKNALDEIGLVADTERGAFFSTGDGTITFLDRNGYHLPPEYTTVQGVFGEQPDNGELCYVDIRLASDSDEVRNLVSVSREGGSMIDAADLTSQAMYGTRTYRRTDLVHQDDAESGVIAAEILDTFAYAANRVEQLTANPTIHPDQLDGLLTLGVLHLIEVRRRTFGFQVVAALQIQAISEQITPDDWSIVFTTFAASNVFDVARWDIDLWDSGLWGY